MCVPANLADATTGRVQDRSPGSTWRPDVSTSTALRRSPTSGRVTCPCDSIPDFSRIGRQQQFFRARAEPKLLSPGEIAKPAGLIRPDRAQHRTRTRAFGIVDMLDLVKQLRADHDGGRGLPRGAGTPRSCTRRSTAVGGVDVVEPTAESYKLFAAISDRRAARHARQAAGPAPTISEANIDGARSSTRVSEGKADAVEQILADSGFDITPGVVDYATFGSVDPGLGDRCTSRGTSRRRRVVAQYFPNLDDRPGAEGRAARRAGRGRHRRGLQARTPSAPEARRDCCHPGRLTCARWYSPAGRGRGSARSRTRTRSS